MDLSEAFALLHFESHESQSLSCTVSEGFCEPQPLQLPPQPPTMMHCGLVAAAAAFVAQCTQYVQPDGIAKAPHVLHKSYFMLTLHVMHTPVETDASLTTPVSLGYLAKASLDKAK